MSESIRFDRAADHYDRTRAISDETMARTIALLASELRDRGRVLEVGVGTGLLALRLHEAGFSLAGLDLSAPMLGKLVEKAGGAPVFPLVLGDATRMPFGDGAFDARVPSVGAPPDPRLARRRSPRWLGWSTPGACCSSAWVRSTR